ncbi:MAG: hypothetical protein QOH14_1545, partial [Pseudonocardiales bacterium]|nr:hypothetical protein [Pseudonocardiales bacterium]
MSEGLTQPPGAELGQLITALDPERLSDAAWVEYLVAVEKQIAYFHALRHE